jgi:hypothetical protein
MAAAKDRNYLAGWLALLIVAGAAFYFMSDPHAGDRRDREGILREQCIAAGRAAHRARNPANPEMNREQAAELVAGCFSAARRDSK